MSELATIREIIDIPLDNLVIGRGQVRVSDVGAEIDELAVSIAKVGLLEPIVVCPTDHEGRYEILTGQRRYLAHRKLNRNTIKAVVLDGKVDDTTAKIISVTENLVRRELNQKDLITVCTELYKRYGSIKSVVEETGLSLAKVSRYVKFDRLKPEMKKLVTEEGIDMKIALKAQDVTEKIGEYDAEEAIKIAKEMSNMSSAQQKKVVDQIEDAPGHIDDAIESAKNGPKVTRLSIDILQHQKAALDKFAADEGTKAVDAAISLIEEGLAVKGYLEDDE